MSAEQTSVKFQVEMRRRTLNQRAIHRLVQTQAFHDAWRVATAVEIKALRAAVDGFDVPFLRKWIDDLNRNSLLDYSIRELRGLGSRYGVTNYSRMQKDELVNALITKGIEIDAKGRTLDSINTAR